MLQLKNVKVHKTLSQETLCFSASMYFNKKHLADVEGRGTGGPPFIRWKNTSMAPQFTQDIAKYLRDVGFETMENISESLSLDCAIEYMASQKETRGDVIRYLRIYDAAVTLKDYPREFYLYKMKAEFQDAQMKMIAARHPASEGYIIYTKNSLPETKI